MATSIRTDHPAASVQVVFEGQTRIGRTYRVLAEGAETLHFQRSFDHAPKEWHTEGVVCHPVDDWQWALGKHITGGDGLEYLDK